MSDVCVGVDDYENPKMETLGSVLSSIYGEDIFRDRDLILIPHILPYNGLTR